MARCSNKGRSHAVASNMEYEHTEKNEERSSVRFRSPASRDLSGISRARFRAIIPRCASRGNESECADNLASMRVCDHVERSWKLIHDVVIVLLLAVRKAMVSSILESAKIGTILPPTTINY